MGRLMVGLMAVLVLASCDSVNGVTDNGPAVDVTSEVSLDVPVTGDTAGVDTGRDDGIPDTGSVDQGTSDLASTDLVVVDVEDSDVEGSDVVLTDLVSNDVAATDLGPTDLGVADVGSQDVPVGPSGHTENNGGVLHKPGKADALANCTSCHGSTLRGDIGPSCYSCHEAKFQASHTLSRSGDMHLPGSTSVCVNCHGPKSGSSAKSSMGGLGPACSNCH